MISLRSFDPHALIQPCWKRTVILSDQLTRKSESLQVPMFLECEDPGFMQGQSLEQGSGFRKSSSIERSGT